MKIELVSHMEHTRLRDKEQALNPDKKRYSYKHWSKVKEMLVKLLRTQAKLDATGYGSGDFYIGEDWFENGAFHVVLLNWNALKAGFLAVCESFVTEGYQEFAVTVAKSLLNAEDYDFEIVITATRCYMSFIEKEAAEGYNIIKNDERFRAIRSFCNIGAPQKKP